MTPETRFPAPEYARQEARRCAARWRLWVILVSSLVVLVAVGLLGGAGFLFRYAGEFAQVAATLPAERTGALREGLPLRPADLRLNQPIAPSQNAATLYRQIDALLRRGGGAGKVEDSAISDFIRRPDDPSLAAAARSVLARRVSVLRLAGRAAALSQCDFERRYELGPDLQFPEYETAREAARLLAARALLESRGGNVHAAFRDIAAGAMIGRHMLKDRTVVSMLVDISIESTMDRAFGRVALRSPIVGTPVDAARDAVRALGSVPSLEDALSGEIVMDLVAVDMVRHGTFSDSEGPGRKMVAAKREAGAGTAADAWEARTISFWRRAFRILRSQADGRTRDRLLKSLSDEQFAHDRDPTYLMNAILCPALGGLAEHVEHAEALGRIREATTDLLAYRQKSGRWPDSLEQACRPVPMDPFDGEPLRYRRTAAGFVLYSIGEDRKDDGGNARSDRPGAHPPDIMVQYPLPN